MISLPVIATDTLVACLRRWCALAEQCHRAASISSEMPLPVQDAGRGVAQTHPQRIEAAPTAAYRKTLIKLSPADVKIAMGSGWVAVRRSGTENICRFGAESFQGSRSSPADCLAQ